VASGVTFSSATEAPTGSTPGTSAIQTSTALA
jgi:hypothetical protein